MGEVLDLWIPRAWDLWESLGHKIYLALDLWESLGQKCIKKEAILSKNDDLGRFSSFPENLFFAGNFSKWIFAEGRSTRSPWCLEKIQGPIWRSKDHLVMKGLSKNVKNHEF